MKANILIAFRLTIVSLLLCVGLYTLLILGFALVTASKGKGELLSQNGRTYYSNIGQSFTRDSYFNSRPSAVHYNAAGSGGSNKGPANPEYLATVRERIDTFLAHNPGIERSAIPADLVTASGSGLDPDLSVSAARVQVRRIAAIRKISETKLLNLIQQQTGQPLLGLFGPEKINVLRLNLSLDSLSKNNKTQP